MAQSGKLILLELNELNFEYIEHYVGHGELPAFARLFARHGYRRTSSESVYEHIEPWIQWVSVHTGKAYDQHKVFRLGDGPGSGLEQIWETLEKRGLKVGAFSPMNAENALRDPAFFVPDPWTRTRVSGPVVLQRLYAAIAQAVNDNAEARITPRSALDLAIGLAAYGRKSRMLQYGCDALHGLRSHWSRAIFLDRLLADCFFSLWRQHRPDFASLFLNGVAHVQHHYLFSSGAYRGGHSNPDWYVGSGKDPVLEIYRLYDRVVGDALEMESAPRVMIATGLHQDPVDEPVYYWRLRDHASFLRKLGCNFASAQARMSRDFLVEFENAAQATAAQALLLSGRDARGVRLFEVDNRGSSLFVTLAYPHSIERGLRVDFGGATVEDFSSEVAFVALKNAHHNGTGYFLDTGDAADAAKAPEIPLTDIWRRVVAAF